MVTALGAPVVAAWIPDSADQRWYVIPDATDPDLVRGWLVAQALHEHAPGVLRRARSADAVDPAFETRAEASARQAIADLDARYEQERRRLEEELERARAIAEPVRQALPYATGAELVDAVSTVLTAAGCASVDIDDLLGRTASADLLVSYGTARRLVEVKSAGGNAPEKLVGALERHLKTRPQLRPDDPVEGGALVVNHQHRSDPQKRSAEVYTRPEFVEGANGPGHLVKTALRLVARLRLASHPSGGDRAVRADRVADER